MKQSVITTNNLTKKYQSFYAVHDAGITIQEGDIYGLIGKNGAGKTTLFKMLLGLSHQTTGTISINGSTNEEALQKARKNIGFYISANFYPYLNAYDNIEYYRKLKGIQDPKETQRVLKIVGLENVQKPFKAFSMGMKQRLGIANAILGNPQIVILDEPVNGLDPQGIVEIRNLIKMLNTEFKMTLLISSHILSELDLVATRFGIIDHGRILAEIDRKDVHQSEPTIFFASNDNVKAAELIQNTFNVETQINEDNVTVNDSNLSTTEIARCLLDNGLELHAIDKNKETLESYYFKLTGGTNNA